MIFECAAFGVQNPGSPVPFGGWVIGERFLNSFAFGPIVTNASPRAPFSSEPTPSDGAPPATVALSASNAPLIFQFFIAQSSQHNGEPVPKPALIKPLSGSQP